MITTILQILISFGILLSSFSVIFLGNKPVLAIVFLIATFVLSAFYLILIGINFIGITYIILYVGAIAVLFLFVIMMLNLKDKDLIQPSSVSFYNGIYSFITVIFFVVITGIFTLSSPKSLLEFKDFKLDPIIVDYLENLKVISELDVDVNTIENVYENIKNLSNADSLLTNITQIESLGHDLYTYNAVLLISLSIILLLAMFATIIISKANAKDPSKKDN